MVLFVVVVLVVDSPVDSPVVVVVVVVVIGGICWREGGGVGSKRQRSVRAARCWKFVFQLEEFFIAILHAPSLRLCPVWCSRDPDVDVAILKCEHLPDCLSPRSLWRLDSCWLTRVACLLKSMILILDRLSSSEKVRASPKGGIRLGWLQVSLRYGSCNGAAA